MSTKFGFPTPTEPSKNLPHRRNKQWQTISGSPHTTRKKISARSSIATGCSKNFGSSAHLSSNTASKFSRLQTIANSTSATFQKHLPNPTRSSCAVVTAICPSSWATSSRWLGSGITKIKRDSCNRIRLISNRTPGLAEIFNIDSRSYFAIKREQIYCFGD